MKLPFVSRERFDQTVGLWAQQCERAYAEIVEWRQQINAQRAVHADEIEKLHAMYERVIAAQATAQKAAVEHAMNLVTYGSPTKKEAIVEEREPDAMTRASREVDQQTITRAMNSLRENYRQIGVPVTEDELRGEATALVTGAPWTPPASLAGLVRD